MPKAHLANLQNAISLLCNYAGHQEEEAAACGIMLTLFAAFSSTKVFATSARVEELSSSIF